jgi:hypothetical protein
MTASEALAALTDLGRGRTVWGLFDGAQDPRIAPWIRGGDVPWGCLYAGPVPAELVEVAPYLVRMDPGRATPLRLLEHGFGRSWGVYLAAGAPLADLRRHFRRYLRVSSEDGKRTMLFRFYDPRVLRLYLPTCTPRELTAFFGPAEELFFERPGGFDVAEALLGRLSLRAAAG